MKCSGDYYVLKLQKKKQQRCAEGVTSAQKYNNFQQIQTNLTPL